MFEKKTLKELLENPLISEIAPEAISGWDLSAEEFYDNTLCEITKKLGWNNPQRGFERLFEVAENGKYYYRLYSDKECENSPEKKGRNIIFFPADGENDDKPFILIVPGGGFVNVWSVTEGWPVADHFNKRGYNVFVLTYRVMTEGSALKAMEDISRAMQIIRDNKDEFHVNPDKYITCGFSAGGYIVCLWNTEKGYRAYGISKPMACFPIYPVTSYRILAEAEVDGELKRDEIARTGVGCSLTDACNSCFEIPDHVEGFPPTAVFVAAEDELVDPKHSKRLVAAIKNKNIDCMLEIGPTGGHGFADGSGMCMEGWPERAVDWFENLQK
ncbi:MAG: alpha/beta hydrolase [Lachnospiraceae bacterium]|nr:alpha/beta hydrolase [Lachnospiraceae bacterium]